MLDLGYYPDPDDPANWPSLYYRANKPLSQADVDAVRAALARFHEGHRTNVEYYKNSGGHLTLALHSEAVGNRADMRGFVSFGDALVARLRLNVTRIRP